MIRKSHKIFLVSLFLFAGYLCRLGNAQTVSGCVDSSADCTAHAKKGYCETYPAVRKQCQLSCKLCPSVKPTTAAPQSPSNNPLTTVAPSQSSSINPITSSIGWTNVSTTCNQTVCAGAADLVPVSRVALSLSTAALCLFARVLCT